MTVGTCTYVSCKTSEQGWFLHVSHMYCTIYIVKRYNDCILAVPPGRQSC